MKKYICIYALVCVAVCLAFISCEKEDQQPSGDSSLYLPLGDMEIYPLGQTVKTSFTSLSNWSVDLSDNWVRVSPEKGKAGMTDLTITFDPYYSKDKIAESVNPRSATITFRSDIGGETKTYQITQERVFISIVEDGKTSDIATEQKFGWEAFNKSYTIKSNVYWKINTWQEGSHFTFKLDNQDIETSKTYNDSHKLSLSANSCFSTKNYTGNLTITPCKNDGSDSKDPREVSLSQDYLIFIVSNEDSFTEGMSHVAQIDGFEEFAGSNKDFYVYCEEGVTPVQKGTTDGLTLTGFDEQRKEAGEIDGRTIYQYKLNAKFKAANPSFDSPNELKSIIKPQASTDTGAEREITFVQNKYLFELKDGDGTFSKHAFKNEGGEKIFTLKTDGKWKISSIPSWVSCYDASDTKLVMNTSYSGEKTIKIKTDQNLLFQDNNELFTLIAGNNESKSVTLSQDKFDLELNVNGLTNNSHVSSHTKTKYGVTVASSGEWTLELVGDVNIVNKENLIDKGDKGKSVSGGNLAFNTNKDKSYKTVTLKLRSKKHDDSNITYTPKTLTITQDELRTNILTEKGGDVFKKGDFIAYNNGEASFYMECSAPWMLESKPTWITLFKGDAKLEESTTVADGNYYTVKMQVENNLSTAYPGRDDRVEFAVDTDGDGNYETPIGFEVSQNCFEFVLPGIADRKGFLAIDEGKNTIKAVVTNGAPITIWKKTNGTWTELDSNHWTNIKLESSTKNNTATTYVYTVNPSDNLPTNNGTTAAQKRSDVFRIGVKGVDELYKDFTLEQDPYTWKLDKNTLNTFEEYKDKQQSITVSKYYSIEGTGYDVILDSDAAQWLGKSPAGNTWTFKTTSINTSTTTKRGGHIKFVVKHAKYPDASKAPVLQTIDVSQEKYTWDVSTSNMKAEYEATDNGDAATIKIKSSGGWKVSKGTNSFVTVSQSTGNGNKTTGESVAVTITPNYSTNVRSENITITNNDDSNKTKTITIKQQAYVFKASSTTVTIGSKKNDAAETKITCSSGDSVWFVDATTVPTWLTVTKTNDTIKFVAKEDNKGAARDADITIKDNTSKLTAKIKVTQSAKQ